MNGIAKNDVSEGLAAFSYPDEHPAVAVWMDPAHGFLQRLHATLQARKAHPARTLVLLPYAQLRPLASRLWGRQWGEGFAPRFETSMNWSAATGAFRASATDVRMDAAWDSLTAQTLLAQAGLADQQDLLAGLLVQAAHQLAPVAAGHGPTARAAWADQARQAVASGMAASAMQWEVAVARIAVEWVAVSAYPSDMLFGEPLWGDVDCLVMVQGLAPDPLAAGLQAHWGEKVQVLPLQAPALAQCPRAAPVQLHACSDAEDEAQRCAALALAHIGQGTFPVALVSSDRALTRRVRALLDGAGVAIRDENGWKLSTSHAAAGLVALLQACAWNASSDAVLNWLKACDALYLPELDTLEAALRRDAVRDWPSAAVSPTVAKQAETLAAVKKVDALRASAKGSHTLAQWLGWLRSALAACGLWEGLESDAAGQKLLETLGLQPDAATEAMLSEALWSQQRLDLAAFSRWVQEALEAASFKPDYPDTEQLAILPMSQMLGRPFAAVVLAGCDEVRLSPAPEPPGHWTAAQRAELGLPSREALQASLLASWNCVLQTPVCDVFWRGSDESAEALSPSPLVQMLQLQPDQATPAADPRAQRMLTPKPTMKPLPTGEHLPVVSLTQGAYADLRQCPYRFFAMRQLGLQQVDELESEVDKRDFGVWLHAVLQHFHAALGRTTPADAATPATRRALLDQASATTTHSMALAEGEFLPFAASWPAVRESYLEWLQTHETKERAVYASGETDHVQHFGTLQIRGRIDRLDNLPGGGVMVLDYKTESSDKTKSRIRDPLEDTQMAFYAALLPNDTLRGVYINISESKTSTMEQADLVQARDALVEGMVSDMQRVAEGAALPALGEGTACDYCQARGLCRKDFWT